MDMIVTSVPEEHFTLSEHSALGEDSTFRSADRKRQWRLGIPLQLDTTKF
jgi:hypothetical protein